MQRRRIVGLAAVAVLAAGGIFGRQIFAQNKPSPAKPAKPAADVQDKSPQNDVGAELVAALKQTPGCLGVDAGQMQSGKLAIFAWWKDKAALVGWYYSDAHQKAMAPMVAGIRAQQEARAKAEGAAGASDTKGGKDGKWDHKPLEFVADGTGPILCIATITPSAAPAVPGFPMAIGQISIELYQPLPGGASFGGTFAPPSVPLEHHRGERTAEPAAPAPGKAPAAPKNG